MNTTISEMRLKDYGYNTKKNDVLRERALTSAFREKGANWVNTQLRNMLRVAKERESIVLFKDKCNFIGSSPEEEIKKLWTNMKGFYITWLFIQRITMLSIQSFWTMLLLTWDGEMCVRVGSQIL